MTRIRLHFLHVAGSETEEKKRKKEDVVEKFSKNDTLSGLPFAKGHYWALHD